MKNVDQRRLNTGSWTQKCFDVRWINARQSKKSLGSPIKRSRGRQAACVAHEVSFLDLIQGEKQFRVLLHQRTYSWADKEIAALFELKADIRGKARFRRCSAASSGLGRRRGT